MAAERFWKFSPHYVYLYVISVSNFLLLQIQQGTIPLAPPIFFSRQSLNFWNLKYTFPLHFCGSQNSTVLTILNFRYTKLSASELKQFNLSPTPMANIMPEQADRWLSQCICQAPISSFYCSPAHNSKCLQFSQSLTREPNNSEANPHNLPHPNVKPMSVCK